MSNQQPTITVHTTPGCPQCITTKRWLDARGVTYSTIDLSQDKAAHAAVKALGYSAAPVVIVNVDGYEDHWSGFRPDKLSEHITAEVAA